MEVSKQVSKMISKRRS